MTVRSGIQAVVFDFYFTLVDAMSNAHEAVADLLRRHGSPRTPEDVMSAWLAHGRPDVERALDGEVPTFRTFHEYWCRYGGDFLAGLGMPADADGWARCRGEAHRSAVVYPDAIDCVAELRSNGLKVAVLSDADDGYIAGCIAHNNLAFDAVVTSEELRCYKPHRSTFFAVSERLRVGSTEVVYVGDTPRTDVVGARNAGMTPIWINRSGRSWPAELDPPDFTITTLSELPDLVAALT